MKPFLVLLLASSLPLSADWPHFRGPQGDNSVADAKIVHSFPSSGPKVLWSFDVHEGYGGSAVAGGEVFAMDRVDQEKDVLLCLDLATGKELWRWEHNLPGRISHPGSRVVPTVEKDAVYASSGFGHVYCVDREKHTARWVFDVAKEFGVQAPRFGYSIHPIVLGDQVIVAPTGDDVGLASLDKVTGKVKWRSKSVGSSHSSPILTTIMDRELLVMPGSDGKDLILCGFDPKDGTQVFRWTKKLNGGRHNAIPNITMVGEDSAFLTGGYGQGTQVIKFSKKDGTMIAELIREIPAGATIHPALQVGKQVFVSAGGGRRGGRPGRRAPSEVAPPADAPPSGLVCMGLDGKVQWSTRSTPSLGEGSIINLGGVIVNQDGADGSLRLIKPGPAYQELAKGTVFTKETGRELWAPLAFSDGRLIMRSQFQLLCVDLRPES